MGINQVIENPVVTLSLIVTNREKLVIEELPWQPWGKAIMLSLHLWKQSVRSAQTWEGWSFKNWRESTFHSWKNLWNKNSVKFESSQKVNFSWNLKWSWGKKMVHFKQDMITKNALWCPQIFNKYGKRLKTKATIMKWLEKHKTYWCLFPYGVCMCVYCKKSLGFSI